jgi:myo-inositol 2-dehydrogenase/D-chiro-inositol 1-dehydrogenase
MHAEVDQTATGGYQRVRLLAGPVPVRPVAPYAAGMLTTVRIGMVGAGAVAARHVRTLLAMDGVEVAGVADPAPGRARELAGLAGAAAYPNHMELLDAERLDAVYICVPPFAHGAPELAVIDAGLPMFVEKPVAIDQETAAMVAARLAERPLLTCTGYHWRWLDIFDRAAELLADRPPRLVQCLWLDKVPPPPWWLRRDGSGGQVIEQTTHVLDTARGLAGEVTEVHAFGARAASFPPTPGSVGHPTTPGSVGHPATPGSVGPRTGRVADGGAEARRLSTAPAGAARAPAEAGLAPAEAARAPAEAGLARAEAALPAADIHEVSVAALRFASGALGTVASTCLLPRLHRAGVQVVGDGLSLELSETELVVEVDGERSAWTAAADARPRPDADFIAAVRGGPDRIRVPWVEAYRTHLLACAITRSAEERRPLPVTPGGRRG